TSILIIAALVVLTAFHFIGALFAIPHSRKVFVQRLLQALLTGALVAFLYYPISHFLILLPIAFALWALVLSLIHFVNFWQYRKEPHTRPLVQLLYSILCLSFSLYFFFNLPASQNTSLQIVGGYICLYAGATLLDVLLSFTPRRIRDKIKGHIHICLPVILASFIPRSALASINKYFAKEGPVSLDVSKEDAAPNAEVLIHVSDRSLQGAMGHADMWIDGVYYSYGCYDEADMKWNGGIGAGTLFTHTEKDAYIKFCQSVSGKALFGFGLALTDSQMTAMKTKLAEIMACTYVWKPDAQRAEEGLIPDEDHQDYASKLYRATHAKFYKFTKGSLKHYFVMGTNCVKLVDTLLRASGVDTVPTGIVAPGTYYDLLNQEFMRPGSPVVTRNVYMSESNIAASIEKEKDTGSENK
ncbi:MAG: hypothetical protein Q4G07_04015, partial [Oscillospiraceae bacterium]|nr:hypothetical protein [Oscillospiraceae bacterium]